VTRDLHESTETNVVKFAATDHLADEELAAIECRGSGCHVADDW
jgi:hypothetical protein